MEAILSTATFFAVILLTALPFVWRYRNHRAILLSLTIGVLGYWLSSVIMSATQLLFESVFFEDVILDLLPTAFLGAVVSSLATFIFETTRYLPLLVVAHLLRAESRLITPAAGAMAVGFWGMMLLRVIWNNSSAAVLTFDAGAPMYLTTIFGVVSYVVLGLALSRGLLKGLVVMGLLILLQIIRGNAHEFLPETPVTGSVVLMVHGLVVIGLYAVSLLLWRRRESSISPNTNGPAVNAGP